ncbi:MAG TPA: hypothetical protein DDX75_01190 [Phycisphaerales bacterium]|nr:hypothetical protein [Phycisphaerales bacterium]
MNVGLYIRVSTLQQVDKDSLELQESMLKSYCKTHGHKVINLFKDAGLSAKKDNVRPALKQLIQFVKEKKIELVLVTKIDRISRSLKDLLDMICLFHEHDVAFVAITQNIDTSGYMGRFTLNLLGAIAELEREMTAERVSEVMRHRASNGKWNGGVIPYGYTTQQRIYKQSIKEKKSKAEAMGIASKLAPQPKLLYTDKDEVIILKQIFKTYIETKSIRETTRQLYLAGYKSRSNKIWATTTISRILNNPTYTGKVLYGKRKTDSKTGKLKKAEVANQTFVDGLHEKLIDDETFKTIQHILSNTSLKKSNAEKQYLLSRLLKCGKCGGSMNGHTYNKSKNEKSYAYYKCSNHFKVPSKCEGLTIPSDKLEDFVIKTLTNLSKDEVFLKDKEKMMKTLEKEASPDESKTKEDLVKLTSTEKDLLSRRDNLLEAMERKLLDDKDFQERYEKLKVDLENNRATQQKLHSFVDNVDIMKNALNASFEEISSFGLNWEYLDFEGKVAKTRAIIKEINVTEEDINIQIYLDTESSSSLSVVPRTDTD